MKPILNQLKKRIITSTDAIKKITSKKLLSKKHFQKVYIKGIRELGSVMISYCEQYDINSTYLPLCEHIEIQYQKDAYGLLLNYLSQTQKRLLDHLRPVELDNDNLYLDMDFATQQNLELITNYRYNTKTDTLWTFLDKCQTAMGSRLLRKWIEKH